MRQCEAKIELTQPDKARVYAADASVNEHTACILNMIKWGILCPFALVMIAVGGIVLLTFLGSI